MDIQFFMPVKVIMGFECIRNNADAFKEMGKKALIVTGKHSSKANGSFKDITDVLTQNAQGYAVYDRVMSNPDIACCYEGAALAKKEQVDFIVAMGGGSPMDAAKAIALLALQDIPEDELFSGRYKSDFLPMVLVPTTAGTGSEVTPYSVLTDHKIQTKMTISSPGLFPKIAFLDARYMENLSYDITVNTAIDALSHSLEGMLSKKANAVTDMLASESIRNIALCFDAMKNKSLTLEHREKLLYASMLAGMVIAQTGTTIVHSMGYSLTYFKGADHGRANGLLLPAFLEFIAASDSKAINNILSLMKLKTVDEFRTIIDILLGEKEQVTSHDIAGYIKKVKQKSIENCIITPDDEDITNIYKKSFGLK